MIIHYLLEVVNPFDPVFSEINPEISNTHL